MLTAARDPRTDPRPGDVVKYRGETYEVVDLAPFGERAGIAYLRNGYGPFRWWREMWQFAERAEVIHAAD